MVSQNDLRAADPQPPAPSRALQRALAEKAAHIDRRSETQRASMVRGLLLLMFIVLLFSFTRAGWSNVFLPGWWRHW
jgi:hypothetical protein